MLNKTRGNPVIIQDPNAIPKPPVKLKEGVKIPPSPETSPAPTPRPNGSNNPLQGVPGYSTAPAESTSPQSMPPALREALPGRDYKYIAAQVVDPKTEKPPIIDPGGRQPARSSRARTPRRSTSSWISRGSTRCRSSRRRASSRSSSSRTSWPRTRPDRSPRSSTARNSNRVSRRGGPLGALLGGGGGGLLGGLLGGGGPTAPSGVNPNRVRVVAERASNSLVVVKATPIDLLTIESLLAQLHRRRRDRGRHHAQALDRPGVQRRCGRDRASIIRELYRSAMETGRGGGGGQQANFPFPFGPQPQQQGNQQRPPALAVSVDDRSNSLILVCSEGMKNDIETLVEQLDSSTVSSTEVVKLVQLKGIDPQLVQTGRERDPGDRAATGPRLRRRRLPRRWRRQLPGRRRIPRRRDGRLPRRRRFPRRRNLRRR